MFKVRRLYTNGITEEQEPVMVGSVIIENTENGNRAIAVKGDTNAIPILNCADVYYLHLVDGVFAIQGIEQIKTGEYVMNVCQRWIVEEVD